MENKNKLCIDKIDTLVFSGGGVKGCVLLGGCQLIHELGIISHVNTFCGSSSGAMISLLLSIGYYPRDIFAIILGIDFKKLAPISSSILSSLTTVFGITDGNKLMSIFVLFITKQGFSQNITLKAFSNDAMIYYLSNNY